ncbi:MAG: hypothetical protein M1820_000202 [Bogoriella megaspora]|nr:MAG: hypothetical protein M1820_000202 [Bogoriella megaspora]
MVATVAGSPLPQDDDVLTLWTTSTTMPRHYRSTKYMTKTATWLGSAQPTAAAIPTATVFVPVAPAPTHDVYAEKMCSSPSFALNEENLRDSGALESFLDWTKSNRADPRETLLQKYVLEKTGYRDYICLSALEGCSKPLGCNDLVRYMSSSGEEVDHNEARKVYFVLKSIQGWLDLSKTFQDSWSEAMAYLDGIKEPLVQKYVCQPSDIDQKECDDLISKAKTILGSSISSYFAAVGTAIGGALALPFGPELGPLLTAVGAGIGSAAGSVTRDLGSSVIDGYDNSICNFTLFNDTNANNVNYLSEIMAGKRKSFYEGIREGFDRANRDEQPRAAGQAAPLAIALRGIGYEIRKANKFESSSTQFKQLLVLSLEVRFIGDIWRRQGGHLHCVPGTGNFADFDQGSNAFNIDGYQCRAAGMAPGARPFPLPGWIVQTHDGVDKVWSSKGGQEYKTGESPENGNMKMEDMFKLSFLTRDLVVNASELQGMSYNGRPINQIPEQLVKLPVGISSHLRPSDQRWLDENTAELVCAPGDQFGSDTYAFMKAVHAGSPDMTCEHGDTIRAKCTNQMMGALEGQGGYLYGHEYCNKMARFHASHDAIRTQRTPDFTIADKGRDTVNRLADQSPDRIEWHFWAYYRWNEHKVKLPDHPHGDDEVKISHDEPWGPETLESLPEQEKRSLSWGEEAWRALFERFHANQGAPEHSHDLAKNINEEAEDIAGNSHRVPYCPK